MESLGLLVGHLIGDYIVQNDWMARMKTVTDLTPDQIQEKCQKVVEATNKTPHPNYVKAIRESAWIEGTAACTVHCLLYTLAVWSCSFWWMSWWGLVVCFLVHWPIDRWRLAGRWMRNVSGQAFFASPEHPLFPWSIVVVDNTFHLLTLFVIGLGNKTWS